MIARGYVAAVTAMLFIAQSPTVWSQRALTKSERECWDRNPGQVEYVKCIASTMEPIDPAKREWYGEVYGAKEYLACALSRPGDSYCDRHRLKRRHFPEYWPDARSASIKWPDPSQRAVHRLGMTPKAYFDSLCRAEAGEFIFKTVEKVEGLYQVRPRGKPAAFELEDAFAMEDPYGHSGTDHTRLQDNLVQPPFGGYRFLESPSNDSDSKTPYVRHFRGDPVPGKTTQIMVPRENGNLRGVVVPYVVHEEPVSDLKSKFGFTWRGIKRPSDRENSIAGGELAVVDLATREILAVRRGFAMTRLRTSKSGPNWEIASECPPNVLGAGDRKFLQKVLKPIGEQGVSNVRK